MTGVAPTARRVHRGRDVAHRAALGAMSMAPRSRRCAPPWSRRPTCTPPRTTGAISSACWRAARSPPPGRAGAHEQDARHHRDGQRRGSCSAGRAAAAAGRFPAPHARPHRHACRLRARRLRRLHGAARWRQRALLPDVRGAGRRLRSRDGRRPRRRPDELHPLQQRSASTTRCNAASARPAC